MVVLGGMGSLNGSIVAAALLAYINFKFNNLFTGNMTAFRNIIYALVLIFIVIVNNAPSLKKFRDRFNFRTLGTFLSAQVQKLVRKFRKKSPEEEEAEIVDHPADWSDIPTKVDMDAILSVDLRHDGEEAEGIKERTEEK